MHYFFAQNADIYFKLGKFFAHDTNVCFRNIIHFFSQQKCAKYTLPLFMSFYTDVTVIVSRFA